MSHTSHTTLDSFPHRRRARAGRLQGSFGQEAPSSSLESLRSATPPANLGCSRRCQG